jgi:hypothetical protein
MTAQVQRELRLLKGYALVLTAGLAAMGLAAFRQGPPNARFTAIDVERINIVEPDGKLRMVISAADGPDSPSPIGPTSTSSTWWPSATRS